MKKAICLLLCLVMALSCVACGGGSGSETTTTSGAGSYTVTVTNQAGAAMADIGVYIYTDAEKTDLVWFERTNADGTVSFTHEAGESCVIVLDGVPDGYAAAESYPVTGETTQIVLEANMTVAGDLTGVTYSKGDIIGDFSVTDIDGTVYTLSELLKEKKVIVLNFWYLNCQPCKSEFPYLQEAYEKYSDQIAVLAMNPVDADNGQIASYKSENGITFPMMACDPAWASAMQITAYPTTVVIDSYGAIQVIHTGAVSDVDSFVGLMADYIDVDAVQETDPTEPETSDATEPATEPSTVPEDDPTTAPTEKGETPTSKPTESTGISPEEAAELMADNVTDCGPSTFSLVVCPGYEAEVNIWRVMTKKYLTIQDQDAYIIYNGKTYTAKNGKVSITISTTIPGEVVNIKVGNSGDSTKTFEVTFSQPKGSWDNPYKLSLNEEFEVNVPSGSEQGIYYTYTATESGTLTLECLSGTEGIEYMFSLYNLSSYEMLTLEEGETSVSIQVKKGEKVKINIAALTDSKGSKYPAAKFTFLATMTTG